MSRWDVADVMTVGAVSVREDTPFKQIVDLLEAHGVNAVPVIDAFERVVGVVSSADLLTKIEFAGEDDRVRMLERRHTRRGRGKAHATAAGELMNAPAVTITGGASLAAAARIMDAAGLKRLPVVDDLGRLVGIVTRRDLLKVFLRADADILRDVEAEALVGAEPAQVRAEVGDGVVTLLGRVERASVVPALIRQIERIDGVADVVSHLSAAGDDEPRPYRAPVMF